MPVYSYLARDRSGRIARSEMAAVSPIDLRSRLHSMDVQLVSFEASRGALGRKLASWINPGSWMPARSIEIELGLHQLAIMLRSGLKLLDALKALQLQTERRSLAKVLQAVHESVSRGESLSDSLARHAMFPRIVVQLVKVGEQSGTLDQSLEQSRDHLAQRRGILVELRIALAYPTVVAAAAISIAVYLVVVVIPQLQKFLATLGRDLPAMTQSLVDLSQWLRVHGSTLMVCAGVLLSGVVLAYFTPRGRLVMHRSILRIPVIGPVLRLAGTAGLASSLSVMMRSGIRLIEALQISTGMQSNVYLAKILRSASRSVAVGRPLAPSLAADHGFAPVLSSMVEVAERSGRMDQTLGEISRLCDSELKARIKSMSRMVEPLVILISGSIVGYVYVAFFVALMSAGSQIR